MKDIKSVIRQNTRGGCRPQNRGFSSRWAHSYPRFAAAKCVEYREPLFRLRLIRRWGSL